MLNVKERCESAVTVFLYCIVRPQCSKPSQPCMQVKTHPTEVTLTLHVAP